MSDKENNLCSRCAYWERAGTQFGFCHRHAPSIPQFQATATKTYSDRIEVTVSTYPSAWWPNTEEKDWCGDWQGTDEP